MSPPTTKKYPTVQRSPSSSPERTLSSSTKVAHSLKSPQRNTIPTSPLVTRSPVQKPHSRYPTVQRSPTYTSPGKSPIPQISPRQLLSPESSISKSQKTVNCPTSFPLPSLLAHKPQTQLPNLNQTSSEQEFRAKKCQDLLHKLTDLRKQIPSELKTFEQNRIVKDAEELMLAVNDKNQTKDENYNLLVKLMKDIKQCNANVNKEKEKQIKPKLPLFVAGVMSNTLEVKEVNVSEKANQEKKHQDEMEMLLDKKKRANFLKVQPKNKVDLKQSQQKLGDMYQKLREIRKSSPGNRNITEFSNLLKEANSIMKFVNETKEPIEDRKLYDLLCTNINAMNNEDSSKPSNTGDLHDTGSQSVTNLAEKSKEITETKLSRNEKDTDKLKRAEAPREELHGKQPTQEKQEINESNKKKNDNNIPKTKESPTKRSESISAQGEIALKQKKTTQMSKQVTTKKSKDREDRKFVNTIKEHEAKNEFKKNKKKTLKSKQVKSPNTKDELKKDSNDSQTVDRNMLMVEKITPVEAGPNEDQAMLDNDFACSNCETPTDLATHTLACKQSTPVSNELMNSINLAKGNSGNSDTEEDVDEVGIEENIYCGEVVTLNRALGASSDSDTEEEEDETIILNNGIDHCDSCPKCKKPLDSSSTNLSIDFVDFSVILVCDGCGVRVRMRGVLGEGQKAFLHCAA